MPRREEILLASEALFKREGVRKVTMDDICKELRISKKTLYRFFGNKAEVVDGVSRMHFERERLVTDELLRQAKDPIHGVLLVLEASASSLREIPTHMLMDIQQYYPASLSHLEEFKKGYVLNVLRENLREGVAKGLYRKDMDLDLVALIRLVQIETGLNENFFPLSQFDFVHVQMEHFKLYLHGIVTLKGKKLIYQYLNQPEDD